MCQGFTASINEKLLAEKGIANKKMNLLHLLYKMTDSWKIDSYLWFQLLHQFNFNMMNIGLALNLLLIDRLTLLSSQHEEQYFPKTVLFGNRFSNQFRNCISWYYTFWWKCCMLEYNSITGGMSCFDYYYYRSFLDIIGSRLTHLFLENYRETLMLRKKKIAYHSTRRKSRQNNSQIHENKIQLRKFLWLSRKVSREA